MRFLIFENYLKNLLYFFMYIIFFFKYVLKLIILYFFKKMSITLYSVFGNYRARAIEVAAEFGGVEINFSNI